MARTWGATRAKFWDVAGAWPSTSPLTVNGATYLETVVDGSVTWTRLISQVGQGSASFYATADWDEWLIPGRVCVVEKVTNHTVGDARLLACFIIEDIEPGVSNGVNVVNVRGPGVESLLAKQLLWSPVGNAVSTVTHLAVKADAPDDRKIAENMSIGNDFVVLDTTNSDDVGQEIRISLDDNTVHVTAVTEREYYNNKWYLHLRDRLPAPASNGQDVEIWTRRIRVDNPGLFLADVSVLVSLNSGTLETFATGEMDTTNRVTLRDGLPSVADAGNAVTVVNPFAPTTSDVTQIVGQAPGWTAVFQTGTGTAQGSAHRPQGESAFDLLSTLSQRTGEFFRQRVLSDPNTPHKSIEWRRTADSSGVTLVMYDSDEQARQVTDEMSLTKGAIFSLSRKRSLPLITRVFPSAGDQLISLANCTSGAVNYANSLGCSVVAGSGLYEPDYVQHDAGHATYGIHEIRQTYGDISISDAKNITALRAACDQLLLSAVQTLVTAQAREYYTVDCYCPVPLLPGQTVRIENATRTVPNVAVGDTWVILEVTERLVGGRPRTTLSVSNMSGLRWTPAAQFAQTIRSIIQGQRRVASGGGTSTIITTGGGGSGGVTDHGDLTGLADDDHPQYLLASGGRALAGNLTVAAGATIDGVDISAHVANPSAHHPPVTVQDASLAINGQSLRVSDAFAGAGLSLAGGIANVNTATAQGTGLTSDTVAVVPSPSAGLQNTAAGVGVRLPANSGLGVDTSGLALGTPGAVSATSANSVSGTQHTHAATATENAKTTPATLLKGSAAGDLTVRYGVADKVTTPLIDTASGGLRLDPANGVTTNDGDLSFVGARAITTDTGSLTLSPAQTLVLSPDDSVVQVGPTTTLRTAHAAVGVFPQTGWQIDYDGHGYFTSLLADELHVQSFIADIMRVKVGGEYIPESMALIRRDITIPAVNASATLYVEDIPGWPGVAVFAENDWVLLRIVSRPAGGLIVASAWGQVTSYSDLSNGEQSWTFTTRLATSAVGQTARAGDIALDYGKTGSSWYYTTVTDPGGPHAGFATWYGANPTDNPEYWLRMGQLRGVTGVYERGLQVGLSTSTRTILSELRNEIHGSRLSLYAGDGGRLQVSAVEVVFYRTGSLSSTLVPDADGPTLNAESTAATFFSVVNEGTAAPNHNTYIANVANMSGSVFLSLSNPAAFTSIFRVDIKAALRSTGLSNDTASLYGQVFASDMATPLTGEVLLATRTTNTTATVTVTAPHAGYGSGGALPADWNGARLRLRWEYAINANEEAIRLDPSIPSLAVGNPLPTAADGGGDGLWVGLNSGVYKLRLGKANGVGLQWTGSALELRNAANVPTIVLDAAGGSRFDGPMTIGTAGGIWQGTGTFASPTTGLKLYNSSGVGRLSTYNAGQEQITLNTSGQLVAGAGAVMLDRNGLKIIDDLPGPYRPSDIRFLSSATDTNYAYMRGNISGLSLGLQQATNAHSISINSDGVYLRNAGQYPTTLLVANGGVTVTSNGTPWDAFGVVGNASVTGTSRIGGSLVVGTSTVTAPPEGVVRLQQRTAAIGTPPAGTADLYILMRNNRQELYIKFDDGSGFTVAQSTA